MEQVVIYLLMVKKFKAKDYEIVAIPKYFKRLVSR